MFKVAVVTPYHNENIDVLTRCHRSVVAQTYGNLQHFMVGDGNSNPVIQNWSNIQHITLPRSHNDAGATPRTIGAISAFSQGFDAVAFLDADNTFENSHINAMLSLFGSRDLVTATRNICDLSGRVLYADTIESDGENFCDTNCLFLSKNCLYLLPYWIVPPEYRLWSDRNFWGALVQANLKRVHCKTPTVNYYTRWAWHYQHAGQTPPEESVWIDKDSNGGLIHTRHKEKVI